MTNNFKDGSVKIADEILDQIATTAAEEVYGVYEDTSEEGFMHSLQSKATKTNIRKIAGNLVIDIDLSLDKNINVRKTVKKVQKNVKDVIETMTGIGVSKVNINVNRLEIWWTEDNRGSGFLSLSSKIQLTI